MKLYQNKDAQMGLNNCSREQLFSRTVVRERVGLSRYCPVYIMCLTLNFLKLTTRTVLFGTDYRRIQMLFTVLSNIWMWREMICTTFENPFNVFSLDDDNMEKDGVACHTLTPSEI